MSVLSGDSRYPISHVRIVPRSDDVDAFNRIESARLKAFFDAIPSFQLLPDEQDAS